MSEQLTKIPVDSSRHNPMPPVDISNINITNNSNKQITDTENTGPHLSLTTKELIDGQCNDIFCTTILN